MIHLDDEQIERLLHRELDGHSEGRLREHLAACSECRTRLADAERKEAELFELMTSLDSRSPQLSAATIMTRTRRPTPAPLRWAATIVIALGAAGVVYALPGSPLRTWLNTLVNSSERATQPPPGSTQATPVSGIAVAPGERLIIEFQSAQEEGTARMQLVDEDEVVVQAANGSASFTSGDDRLLVDNQGSLASFDIRIPRAAPHIEIVLGGRRLLLKRADRIASDVRPDSEGVYSLDLRARN